MRRLLLIPLLLTGCAGGSREYYETRYIPTSGESTFSAAERSKWTGDRTVYELPSAPPDLDQDAAPSPRACARMPGPRFKSQPMVAYGGEVKGSSVADQANIGGWDDRPIPADGYKTQPTSEVGTIGYRAYFTGTVEHDQPTKAGAYDNRPRSVTGVGMDNDKLSTMSGTGRRPVNDYDYCDPK